MEASEKKSLPFGPSFIHPFELHESETNPRRITDERFDALKYALEADPEMLLARPVICTPDAEAVAGNMRLRATREMFGDDRFPRLTNFIREHHGIPTYIAELTEQRKREWMLRDNQEYGEYVPDELAELIREHQEDGGDMGLLGFSSTEIDALVKEADKGMGAGIGNGDPVPDLWGIVVECESEADQAALLERLTNDGFNCRALL